MPARLDQLNQRIINCDRCPRLIEHCKTIATEKRAAYRDDDYWGRPVPNFGSARAKLLIVGLAPGAHGANRTGRMFTGDRSGDWLYRALHKTGISSQAESYGSDDGLRLTNCVITSACHCAPPDNKPQPTEIENCRPWFEDTVELLRPRVFVALGGIAWTAVFRHATAVGWHSGKRPRFGHLATAPLSDDRWVIGSYHPSQQNTFTGRLTEPMLDEVFIMATTLLG